MANAEVRPRHLAWRIAAMAFFVLLFSSSVRGTFALLISPLMKEYGWSRSVTTLPASVNLLVFGFTGPFAAALMVRFGLRKVVVASLIVIALGALGATQATAPWHLIVAWGVVMGLGMGCTATVLASSVASTWFFEKRGVVTGVLVAAGTAGQMIFIPLNRWLVATYSWRAANVVIAVATLGSIVLVLIFVVNRPEDRGLTAYGAPAGYEAPIRTERPIRQALEGLRDAWNSGLFWILWGSFFICGITTNGLVQTHWFESTADHGITRSTASTLLVTIGLFDLFGSLASGWLTDRFDPRHLLFAYYAFRGLSLFALDSVLKLGATNIGLLTVIAFYGLDWVATVPPTIVLANRLFGPQRGSIVYGWLFAGHQLGAAVAAWASAAARDWTGSFRLAYTVGGVLCIVAAFGVLRIGRPDERRLDSRGGAVATPPPLIQPVS
jgi:MFS family permease